MRLKKSGFSRVAVIGAGPCGLTAAKNLVQSGFDVQVFERGSEIGGVWNFNKPQGRVYRSTHLISSKKMTEYTDFPFPSDFPDYPHHMQALSYLQAYCRHFNLDQFIRFDTEVLSASYEHRRWRLVLSGGETEVFDSLVVANGHLWDSKLPQYEGIFSGEILHSAEYRDPKIFENKRVLVVGAGNSGCDIAVDAIPRASNISISMRRGYHFVPKFMYGAPSDIAGDRLFHLPLPLPLKLWISALLLRVHSGRPENNGLFKPDHHLFETHPIVNTLLTYHLGQGDISIRPDIARFNGDKVEFVDGTKEQYDIIVCATGYKVTTPFLPKELIEWDMNPPELFINIFHPRIDGLFFVGLIQTNSGLWGIADRQAQLVARYLRLKQEPNRFIHKFETWRRESKPVAGQKLKYVKTARHSMAIEYSTYITGLSSLIKKFDRSLKAKNVLGHERASDE